ncbi:MAG: HAMP domain-containing sensor histidine kinase [Candidatus Faecousia sp.]|nr:HAMP domain-containing sensor histidine kinase [Candidatus Faecousia sp.]
MKYHIVFKFLAVALCAAFLLVSLASAAGILLLASQGLYGTSLDSLLERAEESALERYAQYVGSRYASVNLGGCPEEMIESLDGWMEEDYAQNQFQPGAVGYRIQDPEGNVVEDCGLESYSRVVNFPFTDSYRELLSLKTREAYDNQTAPTIDQNALLYNAIPSRGTMVSAAYFYDENGSELVSTTETGVSALAYYSQDGDVLLRTTGPMELMLSETEVAGASFYDENGGMLYQTFSREGVGTIWVDSEGCLCFAAYAAGDALPADIPEDGVEVYSISLTYGDESSESLGGVEPLGTLEYMEDGRARFRSVAGETLSMTEGNTVTAISFRDAKGNVLLEAEGGTVTLADGEFTWEEAAPVGDAVRPEPAESAVEETAAPEPEETAASEERPATLAVPSYKANSYSYYDSGYQDVMVAEFYYQELTGYTVSLTLQEPVMRHSEVADALRLLWSYRNALFGILAVSVLLFAVCAVYLCCAAGRKPGRDSVKAGGLNLIPLDAYALGVGLADVGIVWLLAEGMEYLLNQGLLFAAGTAAAAGYGACVLFVGFCFAFAAQVKTPGGLWWRNSACGWCMRLLVAACRLAIRIIVWCWVQLEKLWNWALPLGKRVLRAVWKLVKFSWLELKKLCGRLFSVLEKCMIWLGKTLARFADLLPLTWQWLVAAFVLLFALGITISTERVGWILLGVCTVLAVVLYGSGAFGTLLESAKRMRRGDLDTKVDDGLLVGCFRDFAQELNGLADVAVVAAQKQLKSERMKTELITNVSHDIKTPLTSIINYVDLMSKPHSEEEQELYLEVLSRQSQRLKKLIDDLMEMSKASTGNIPVDIARVDAAEAVNQALGEFGDKLAKANLTPVFRRPEEPVEMLADGRLVWRVLSNVLSNAVKYALPGTRLYVDLTTLEGKVLISLKNISREELNVEADELMERFVRGDASRNTEGSGLGLNIAKSLMELQKGQLQLLVDGDLFKVTLIFPQA